MTLWSSKGLKGFVPLQFGLCKRNTKYREFVLPLPQSSGTGNGVLGERLSNYPEEERIK